MDWNIVWKKLFRVLFVVWRDKGVGKKEENEENVKVQSEKVMCYLWVCY